VVDEVRVLRLLRSVTDDLAVLRGEASADARRQADALWLRGVKYTFWQGFRNVLVHEYVEVDDSVVLARLTDPSNLDEFVAAVVEWTSSDR
jgi:uncharacterized protein with HEPN domain